MKIASRISRRRSGGNGQAGFTLIELIVALALLGLAMAMLPGILRLGAQTWNARAELDRLNGPTLALEMIERRLAQALPLFERDAAGGVRVLFRGDAHSIEFVGPAQSGPAGPGLYRHRLGPRSSERGDAPGDGLVLELAIHEPARTVSSDAAAASRHVIADRGFSVRFRYFGSPRRNAGAVWQDVWPRFDALPTLIEATARTRSGDSDHTRRIMIAPRIAPRS